MRFGVLGPTAITGERPVEIAGPQLRRLLAVLVLHADRVVSTDQLSTVVFGDTAGDSAATNVRSYIARLRRLLEDDGSGATIVTVAPGYQLELGSSTIDAVEFEGAVAEARAALRAGRARDAVAAVEEGLALWRGPAYFGFEDEDWAMAEAQRLEELRLTALELLHDAKIAAGEHAEAVAGLTAFVNANPLRGAATGSLMVALYRSERQTEALRVAQRHRSALADAGLEPTPNLVELERRISAHDPSLARDAAGGPQHVRTYELIEPIGGSPYGTRHRARQSGVGREVTVLRIDARIADHPDFVRHFEPLVRRVAALDHPNVETIVDVWREPGAAFLVTPHAPGGTFADLLAKAPIGVDRVVAVVEGAAAGLRAAHVAGLAHGVLRPDDLLLDDAGGVAVSGIGIEALVADLTADGEASAIDAPADDQSALASLARAALIGAPVDERPAPADDTRVSEVRPELLALDGVLARAGAAAPEDRYPDIAIFAEAFAAAAGAPGAPRRAMAAVANPYKGLLAFDEADAADFHGREDVVDRLVERVRGSTVSSRFTTVIGPSGSGKSSVVRAGLIPRLRDGSGAGATASWFVATMIPGRSPFTELGRAIETVAAGPRTRLLDPATDGVGAAIRRAVPPGSTLLLVIDQFEELFTLTDDVERRSFVDGVADAVADPRTNLRIVATLRADFYDRPLAEPRLGELVAAGTFPLVGMRPAEIERAVAAPAERCGVEIDGRVVAEIVAEISDHETALPLLQYCLTELFERRRGSTITLDDYRAIGGVAGSIADAAEERYQRAGDEDAAAVQQVMLRLVVADEHRADLRRRTPRAELLQLPCGEAGVVRVLEAFGRARLLAFDRHPGTREETVEVAHESLLRTWPRLREWVRESTRSLMVRDEVSAGAHAWRAGGEDPSDLVRGPRLSIAEQWAAEHGDQVGALERRFLEASVAARTRAEALEQDAADRRRRSNRRLRRTLVAAVALLVVAVVASGLALVQRNRADDRTAEAELARARTLAVTAEQAVTHDRSLALLLAVEAARVSDSTDTRRALFQALTGSGEAFTRTVIPTPASDYVALAVSADGQLAAARRGDGSFDVVDLETRTVQLAGIPGPARPAGGIDFDPTGKWIVTAGTGDGPTVVVRDVADGSVVTRLQVGSVAVPEAHFTPDGATLLVADQVDALTAYDVSTWTVARRVPVPGLGEVTAFDITDDGERAVVAGTTFGETLEDAGPTVLASVDLGDGRVVAGPLQLDAGIVGAVEIVEEMGAVVVGDDTLRLFDLATLQPAIDPLGDSLLGYSDAALGGRGLLVGGSEIDLRAYVDTGEGFEEIDLPSDAAAPGIALIDGGATMVTADPGGSISTWATGWITDLGEVAEPPGPGLLERSPDGDTVLAWGLGRGVRLLDATTLAERGALDIGSDRSIMGVDFDPSGGRIVTATCPFDEEPSCPARFEVWDARSRARVLGPVDAGDMWFASMSAVAFTGDGSTIVTAGSDGAVRRWDAATGEPFGRPLRLDDVAPFPGDEVRELVTATVRGRSLLAAKGELSEAVVWDLTDGGAEPLGVLSGGISDVGIGPRGTILAAQGRGTLRLHRVPSLEPVAPAFVSDVNSSWFRVFGDRLVSSGGFGTQVWDAETGENLTGVIPAATAVLAPQGDVLHLGGVGRGDAAGDLIRSLPLDTDWLVTEACRRAGRNLTAAERALYLPERQGSSPTCPAWPVPGA